MTGQLFALHILICHEDKSQGKKNEAHLFSTQPLPLPHSVHDVGLKSRGGSGSLIGHGADSGISTELNLSVRWSLSGVSKPGKPPVAPRTMLKWDFCGKKESQGGRQGTGNGLDSQIKELGSILLTL